MQKVSNHYVPQFYLRNFSQNSKSIGLYLVKKRKYIEHASIKNQACKDYLYGKDGKIEDWFMEIEKETSSIISSIIDNNKLPSKFSDDYKILLKFMLLAEARNLKTADSQNNLINTLVKNMAEMDPKINNDQIKNLDVKQSIPNLYSIQAAVNIYPILFDLKSTLLISENDRKFFTSDNPLIRYNLMYIKRDYSMRGYGLGNVGVQLFFPISPRLCILIFDDKVYNYKEDNGKIHINRGKYMDELNRLFYLNSYNNIFFSQNTLKSYIIRLSNKIEHENNSLETECKVFGDKTNKLIGYFTNQVNKRIKLPFLKVKTRFMNMNLPPHMGGPVRPYARKFMDN